jgi:hypothetical protein
MLWATMRRPAFAAAKAAKFSLPRRLAEAPVRSTVPRPRGARRRAASRATRKPPRQHTRQTSSNRATLTSRRPLRWIVPALKTTTSASSSGARVRTRRPGAEGTVEEAEDVGLARRVGDVALGMPPGRAMDWATASSLGAVRPARCTL